MKQLLRFAVQFGAQITLNPDLVLERGSRFYLLNASLQSFTARQFFFAGLYLGKTKKGVFFPSFNLLNLLVPSAQNKVVLDRKAAWLFICGRDVFRKGVLKTFGPKGKGTAVLVLNEFGECLGFGRLTGGSGEVEDGVAVRNVLDLGDFLRRERRF